MKYSEIFYTLQGEGKLIGIPSVFFRTSYCNLRCGWCDTPYTSWNPENKQISVAEALKQITQFKSKYVVITGGEPFLQKDELTELCQQLATNGHHITIETNATIFAPVAANLISMSPKLSNSIPIDKQWQKIHEAGRIKLEVMSSFLKQYDCQVKFVINSERDIEEVQDLVNSLSIPTESVVLMPQGINSDEIKQRQHWLAEVCKKMKYRYSPRLHLSIWGDKRGT
ncbi:MAG: 7-carboxy-7-deazaguanine synthase QueE [Thiomargarita sp.]|nr:7-carboxy-7-deazaguanine synthase QueE [Thiomargarita sp.]